MTDRQFAEIIVRAMIMIIRAANVRYGLRLWIITGDEKKKLSLALQGDNSPCAQAFRECMKE